MLRVADRVGDVFEHEPSIVRLDGKHFAEHGLETLGFPLLVGHTLLQVVEIGIDLNLDQIRRRNDFFELTEIDAFGVSAVGHDYSRLNEKGRSADAPAR